MKKEMSQNLLQWTVADVASYFSAAGFPEQAVAFRTQVSAPLQRALLIHQSLTSHIPSLHAFSFKKAAHVWVCCTVQNWSSAFSRWRVECVVRLNFQSVPLETKVLR